MESPERQRRRGLTERKRKLGGLELTKDIWPFIG